MSETTDFDRTNQNSEKENRVRLDKASTFTLYKREFEYKSVIPWLSLAFPSPPEGTSAVFNHLTELRTTFSSTSHQKEASNHRIYPHFVLSELTDTD